MNAQHAGLTVKRLSALDNPTTGPRLSLWPSYPGTGGNPYVETKIAPGIIPTMEKSLRWFFKETVSIDGFLG